MRSEASTETRVATDGRLTRGIEIASHPETIEKVGEVEWSVPSQTGFGRYRVWFVEQDGRCTCPDYSKRIDPRTNRTTPCKHIFAVMELRLREAGQSLVLPSTKVRKQYPQHPSYTKGQTTEMRLLDTLLHDLVADIPDMPKIAEKGGRPAIPLSEALYCAILKVYSGLSGRRACGVYENVSDRDLLESVPSYNVASRALNRPEATAVLYRLLQLSAAPLAGLEEGGVVAPDSTGVQTTSFGGWREEKHGEKREKRWLKVHAIVGTKTHVVIDARVLEKDSGDSPQFKPLILGVFEAGFHPKTALGDKGYLSRDNYTFATEMGLETFIPFKSNSTGKGEGSAAWRKAFYLFQANREEFDRNYHKRSNVESVFSALKRKFGENIRSRTGVAQVNEILAKLICYNLTVVVHEMFENGVAPAFVNQNPVA
jgi:transposase